MTPQSTYDLNNLTDLHNLVDGDHNVHHNIVVHDGDVVHAAVAAGDTFAVVVAVADRVDHVSFVGGVGGASPRPNHFGQAPTFLPISGDLVKKIRIISFIKSALLWLYSNIY